MKNCLEQKKKPPSNGSLKQRNKLYEVGNDWQIESGVYFTTTLYTLQILQNRGSIFKLLILKPGIYTMALKVTY